MKILKNAIITPDGTELRSYHRHDYKSHKDKLTGDVYIVDGGTEYLRRQGPPNYKDASVFDTGVHETIRENFCWGSYGKGGIFPEPKYVPLKNIGDEHLSNILNELTYRQAQAGYPLDSLRYVKEEYHYRFKNNITVEETIYEGV